LFVDSRLASKNYLSRTGAFIQVQAWLPELAWRLAHRLQTPMFGIEATMKEAPHRSLCGGTPPIDA
jgi:hypothetical protein